MAVKAASNRRGVVVLIRLPRDKALPAAVVRPAVCSRAAAVYPRFGGPWQTWGGARLRIGLITDASRTRGHGALRLRASGYELVCLMAAYNLRLKRIDTALRASALLRRDGRRPRLAVVGGVPDPLWYEPLHRMGSSVGGRSMLAMWQVTPWARNLHDVLDDWRVRIGSEAKEN